MRPASLACCLAHSGPLWLSLARCLAHSDSLWLSLACSPALSGSLLLALALSGSLLLSEFAYNILAQLTRPLFSSNGAAALQHFMLPCRNHFLFSFSSRNKRLKKKFSSQSTRLKERNSHSCLEKLRIFSSIYGEKKDT